jgi:hypothetical protein
VPHTIIIMLKDETKRTTLKQRRTQMSRELSTNQAVTAKDRHLDSRLGHASAATGLIATGFRQRGGIELTQASLRRRCRNRGTGSGGRPRQAPQPRPHGSVPFVGVVCVLLGVWAFSGRVIVDSG